MEKLFKKTLIFLLSAIFAFALISCDNLSTTSTSLTSITTGTTVTADPLTTTSTTFTTASSTTVSTTTNGNVGLQVINITKTEYNLQSTFDLNSIIVVLLKASGATITLSSSVYTVTGFDSSSTGEKTVVISYLDLSTSFVITVVEASTEFIITMAYYLAAKDLTGQALLLKLRQIINTGFSGVTYGAARYILDETDRDPNNPSKVILVYLGTSVSGVWDGVTWNREHVWPQSLLGVSADNGTVNVASDLQNLKPANPAENSRRSNSYFANVAVSSVSYTPRDAVKGDIARILFYMMIMYSNLTLVNNTPSVYQMALLSVLLEWNDLDPVDDFERNRNNIIESYQGNRNPFIDYPEFVDLIWDYLT